MASIKDHSDGPVCSAGVVASTRDILMDIFGLPGWYGVAWAIEYNGGRCRLDGWREFLDFSEDGL